MSDVSIQTPLTIYHDGSCPICRAEMEVLKEADVDDRLELIDCSSDGFSDARCDEAGLTQSDLMSALHVVDAKDRWLQGPDAFAAIYLELGFERMARFWGRGWWRPAVNLMYRLFAVTRGWLAPLGLDRAVRWWVRREAEQAASRAQSCRSD